MHYLVVLDRWGHEETFTDPETGLVYTQTVGEREPRFAPDIVTVGDEWGDDIGPLRSEQIVPELGLGMWRVKTTSLPTVEKLFAECVDVLYYEEAA